MRTLTGLLLIIVFAFSCNSKPKQKQNQVDDRGYIVKVGDKAPNFEFQDTQGKTIKLSDLKGKVVMLQFTASWCGVCIKEMPFIEQEIWNKHKANPKFALYGVDRDEPLETVLKFAKKTGVTYPLVLDPEANVFALFADKQAGVTRNVIIGEDGTIKLLTRLFNREEFDKMKEVIDALLEN